jgi:hypothetical protein
MTPTTPSVVFLVGQGHSGKTEVAAAFRHRPGTAVVRRAYFWRDASECLGSPVDGPGLDRCLTRITRDPFLRSAGVDADRLAGLIAPAPAPLTFGGVFLLATAAAVGRVGGEVPARLVVQIGGLEHLAPAVARDLPQALFIHTVRDPRQYFGRPARRSRPGDLGWRLASWSASAAAAVRNSNDLADRYLLVRAEDVTRFPGRVAAAISSHVGSDIEFGDDSGSVSVKGSPLGRRQAMVVESLVGPLLAGLGYPVEPPARPGAAAPARLEAGMFHLRHRVALRGGETA